MSTLGIVRSASLLALGLCLPLFGMAAAPSALAGTLLWTRTYDRHGSADARGLGVAVGPDGSALVTGQAYREGQGFDLLLRKYSPSGGLVWARHFDGAAHESDHGAGVAVGADGSVLFTGDTWVDGQGYDLLLRKYSAAGDFLWARTYGGAPNQDDVGLGVAIAPDGCVYATGHARGQGRLPDLLLQKYSAGGDHLWTRTWNGATNGADRGESVAVGRDGSVYVTGVADEWVKNAALGEGNALLLQRYSPAGTLLWTRTMKRGDWNEGCGVAVDDSGAVYVTGSYLEQAAPSRVLFLRKYAASGRVLWTRTTTGSTWGIGNGVAIDSGGDVHVAGAAYVEGEGFNLLLRQYSSTGRLLWSGSFNGTSNENDVGEGIAVARDGSVYVTGSTWVSGQGLLLLLQKYR